MFCIATKKYFSASREYNIGPVCLQQDDSQINAKLVGTP